MTTHWHRVWDEPVEDRPLKIEREDGRDYFRVWARQSQHDEGIAYQDGANYVHVSPSSAGEDVEGEGSSLQALAEVLREMHFSAESVARVVDAVAAAG